MILLMLFFFTCLKKPDFHASEDAGLQRGQRERPFSCIGTIRRPAGACGESRPCCFTRDMEGKAIRHQRGGFHQGSDLFDLNDRSRKGICDRIRVSLLSTMVSMIFAFIDASRRTAVNSSAEALCSLWAESVLAEYDLNLQRRYNVFGLLRISEGRDRQAGLLRGRLFPGQEVHRIRRQQLQPSTTTRSRTWIFSVNSW